MNHAQDAAVAFNADLLAFARQFDIEPPHPSTVASTLASTLASLPPNTNSLHRGGRSAFGRSAFGRSASFGRASSRVATATTSPVRVRSASAHASPLGVTATAGGRRYSPPSQGRALSFRRTALH